MIFLILVVVGALTYLLTSLSPEEMRARRDRQTVEALAQAREALIGYALKYREDQIDDEQYDRVYGYLPLPDLGSSRNNNSIDVNCTGLEGCEAYNFYGNGANVTVIGRFPWRKLGIAPLRDGYGECLWYAVSGSHQRNQPSTPLNWDTIGQLDHVTITAGALAAENVPLHDRPVAIIFSPGPSYSGRTRSTVDDVQECEGNYTVGDYLDVTNLVPIFDTGNSANGASGNTGTQPKPLSIRGKITIGGNEVANDIGLPITSDTLFRALRKSSYFRLDINSMLDRMVGCLRDEFAKPGGGLVLDVNSAGLPASPSDKIAGRVPAYDTCYGNDIDPLGYFSNYKGQIFVAKPNSGTFGATIDGAAQTCAGVLVLGSQRGTTQQRKSATERNDYANYLEGSNYTGFMTSSTTFSGHSQFARVTPTHPAEQDIVRCIPAEESFTEAPSELLSTDDLIRYNAATRTLTLGRQNIESDEGFAAGKLFGCSWTPEARATGSGFRSYFTFYMKDRGDGFVFAAVDGDRNGTNVCGAGEQHLGYSGNNGYTTPINYPKIGLEFDTRKNYETNPDAGFVPDGFFPGRRSPDWPRPLLTLTNGRSDPDYPGHHFSIAYWGGESPISTGLPCQWWGCPSPSFCNAGMCMLKQEEDDNVHGQLPAPPAVRPPPMNTPRVDNPATPGLDLGYYPYPPPYLPPALAPLNVDTDKFIHVRVEIERSAYAGRDDNSRLVKVVAAAQLASLAGLQTIDSVSLQSGDTVLVTAQADTTTNGAYAASSASWTRLASANEAADLPPGTSWFIKEGTIHRGSLWRLQDIEAPVVGISPLTIQRVREPVKTVATTNIALTGLQTVGGVALSAGDRVLLTNQTDQKQNGVYAASSGAWLRATPEDTAAGMRDGAMWFSTGGPGGYWRLEGDVTPGSSNIVIGAISSPSNKIHSAVMTTKVWKLTDSTTTANQASRMKMTSRSMNQLDPVVRHGTCAPSAPLCPDANPADQSCGGVETDGLHYCYTGQKPTLYDSKKIFDIRSTTSCGSNVSCSGNQFCGIDNVCYQPAFRTTRLGFTNSQSTSDQEIDISNFFTTWLP